MSVRASILAALSRLLGVSPSPAVASEPAPHQPSDADEALAWFRQQEQAHNDRGDSWVFSGDTGIGSLTRDKVSRTRPPTQVVPLSDTELRGLIFRSGLAHRVCYGPPTAAVRNGWSTDLGDDVGITAELDTALGVRQKLARAIGIANRSGGAHLLPIIEGEQDLAEELKPGEHDVVALHVVRPIEAIPVAWDTDPKSDRLGRPLVWDVTVRKQSTAVHLGRVHASRMVYVPGIDLDDPEASPPRPGYDYPLLELYWTALRNLGLQLSAGVHLGLSLSEEWLRLKSGRSMAAGTAGQGNASGSPMRKALDLYNRSRSVMGTKVLLGDDEVGRVNASISGRRDLVLEAYEAVSSVQGIPLVKLLGMSPAGLTSDDMSATRSWNELLVTIETDRAEPALRGLYDIALGEDPERVIVWRPLDEPTEGEIADTDLKRAQRDAVLVSTGVIDEVEARARYAGAEVLSYPVVVGDLEEPGEEPIETPPALMDDEPDEDDDGGA